VRKNQEGAAVVPVLFVVLSGLPSPGALAGQRFYDERYVSALDGSRLQSQWPTLEFVGSDVVVVFDGERTRVTFKVVATKGGFLLSGKDESGNPATATWRWLDADRAETTLWGSLRIASRKAPTPWQRNEAAGLQLARALTSTAGAWKWPDGGVAIALPADGGVIWGATTRLFDTCRWDCAEGAPEHLCVTLGSAEYLLEPDAGVAPPVAWRDLCGARERKPGAGLQWVPSRPR
jgi:hypothetical protein